MRGAMQWSLVCWTDECEARIEGTSASGAVNAGWRQDALGRWRCPRHSCESCGSDNPCLHELESAQESSVDHIINCAGPNCSVSSVRDPSGRSGSTDRPTGWTFYQDKWFCSTCTRRNARVALSLEKDPSRPRDLPVDDRMVESTVKIMETYDQFRDSFREPLTASKLLAVCGCGKSIPLDEAKGAWYRTSWRIPGIEWVCTDCSAKIEKTHVRFVEEVVKKGKSGTDWHARFADLASHVAAWSKDPSTRVGAVIVRDKIVLGIGYNGFPRGVRDNAERYADKPTKYKLVVHAESNAILNAVGSVRGASLYSSKAPCSECCKLIVQSSIREVWAPAWSKDEPWASDAEFARLILMEGGVKWTE